MITIHKLFFNCAQNMDDIDSKSIALAVTSPPYPLIKMWDSVFSLQNDKIKVALNSDNGLRAFETMHFELDKAWEEIFRVMIPGGIVCIIVGDTTRSFASNFQLFPSHVRIITAFHHLGFQSLPSIIWRKPTNTPNKFLGSGMLPPSAYVTLEHEHILIFRKGAKRSFPTRLARQKRRESAYFWEERNSWFSDVWELNGIPQAFPATAPRNRSGAFPFDLAYRLINMFSVRHDYIIDPFLGTGTTSLAAMISERNSFGYELARSLRPIIQARFRDIVSFGNRYIEERIRLHSDFSIRQKDNKRPFKYFNKNLGMPVFSSQEKDLQINRLSEIKERNCEFVVNYIPYLNN